MKLTPSRYRKWARRWAIARAVLREVAFSGLAGMMAVAFYNVTIFNDFEPARFSRVLAHAAMRPYAGRVLVPWASKLLSHLGDPTTLLGTRLHTTFVTWGAEHFVAAADVRIVAWLILLGTLAFRGAIEGFAGLLARFGKTSKEGTILVTVLSVLTLRVCFDFGDHFDYDPLTICLGTALFYWLEARRPVLFALTLVLAMMNKETAFVFVPVGAFMIAARSRSLPKTILWTLSHAVLAFAVWGSIVWSQHLWGPTSVRDNFLRDYAHDNLSKFVRSDTWDDFRNWLAFVFSGWLVFRKFGERPLLLRAGLVAPLFLLIGYVRGSLFGEVRVFYEAFCPIAMLAALSLAELTSSPKKVGWVRMRERTAVVVGIVTLAALHWASICSMTRLLGAT
jgi:hypothetical protein